MSDIPPFRISLICATRDRPGELARLIDSVVQQADKICDLVVVNTSVRQLQLKATERGGCGQVKILEGPLLSVSEARNAGVNMCEGNLLLFPDDDAYFPNGHFEAVIKAAEKYARADAWHFNYMDPNTGAKHDDVVVPDGAPMTIREAMRRGSAICIAMRRDVHVAMGGFDTRFGPGHGPICEVAEDVEYLVRAIAQYRSVAVVNSISCYHRIDAEPNLTSSRVRRIEHDGGARWYLTRKYFGWKSAALLLAAYLIGAMYGVVRFKARSVKTYAARLRGAAGVGRLLWRSDAVRS